jgi:membrane-bound metal-dependent hydrolase YbcI (DUF457 family)
MLGYSHAVSGALVWLAAAPAASIALSHPLTPGELAAGTIVCAGAALVPDLDHPQATVARTFGPPSMALAKFVNLVSGGHRHGTHTLLFAILFGAFCQFLVWLFGDWGAWGTVFVLSAFAIRGLNIVPPKASGGIKTLVILGESALLVYLLSQTTLGWWWVGLAAGIGCVTHCLGDSCTPERVPWFLPISKKRLGVGIIARTGNATETKIVTPIMMLIVIWLIYIRFYHLIPLPWN